MEYVNALSDVYDMIATKHLDMFKPNIEVVNIMIDIRDMIDKEIDAMDSYHEKIGLDD